MKRIAFIAAVMLALALMAAPAAFAAPAVTTSTVPVAVGKPANLAEAPYVVTSALSRKIALDVAGASADNGAKIQVFSSNTTAAQRWRLESLGSTGYYRIVNVSSGKVLDVTGGVARAGTRVQQFQWNNTDSQKWAISKVSGGYVLTSKLSSKLVLDVAGGSAKNGTAVQVYTYNGTKSQVWSFIKRTSSVPDGIYTFTNKNSAKLLDLAGSEANRGANIQQFQGNGTLAQRFKVTYDKKSGYYRVISAASGLALDVANASVADGANVQQWTPNSGNAQKWSIIENADGSYTLRSGASGKALDVAGGSKANGANVQQWKSNGTAAQKWTLKKVANWLPDGIYNFVTANNTKNALGVAKDARTSGANVQSATRSDSTWAQCWVVVADKKNPGFYTIRNLNSRMALDVSGGEKADGTNVQQWGMNATASQLWKPILTNGGIVWQSKLDTSKVIDLAGGHTGAGTNVQIYQRNNSIAQKFRLKGVGLGDLLKSTAVVIRNMDSNKVFDVSNGSAANGAKLQLWDYNGTSAQKYRFRKSGNGYSIINTNANKAVDIDTGSKSKLQIWESTSASNQRWQVAFDKTTATFTLSSTYVGKRLDGKGGKLSLKASANTDAQRWILQPIKADYFRVYLNSGHGWNSNGNGAWDTGARGAGVEEAVFASDLCDRIIKIGREQYGLDIVDGRPYELAYWKRLPKAIELGCSTIFSIHFDAGGGSGPMTMVGVDGRHPASLTFESIMGRHLYSALPDLRHRGLFYRNDITCVNGNIPAVLVEVCFMDNPSDVAYYQPRRDTVARELAKGLYEASQVQSLRKNM